MKRYLFMLFIFMTLIYTLECKEKTIAKDLYSLSGIKETSGLLSGQLKNDIYIYKSKDNTIMLPLREILEKLDFQIFWDNKNKICYVRKGNRRAKIRLGSTLYGNDKNSNISLNTESVILNDKLYVPMDVFYHLLSYDVYTVDNTLYIRNQVEDIVTSYIKNENGEFSFPLIFNMDAASIKTKINNCIKKTVDDIIKKMKGNDNVRKSFMSYDIAKYDDKILSICFYLKNKFDKDESKNYFQSYNFDMNTGEEIKYSDIINLTDDNIDIINKRFKSSSNNIADMSVINSKDKYFYVVDNSIIIYYYLGDKGYSAINSIFIRKPELDNFINDKYKKIFN